MSEKRGRKPMAREVIQHRIFYTRLKAGDAKSLDKLCKIKNQKYSEVIRDAIVEKIAKELADDKGN
jgi:hypothetical protein